MNTANSAPPAKKSLDRISVLPIYQRFGHATAKGKFVAVLEILPVKSVLTAVRGQIVKDIKTGYAKLSS